MDFRRLGRRFVRRLLDYICSRIVAEVLSIWGIAQITAALNRLLAEPGERIDIVDNLGETLHYPQVKVLAGGVDRVSVGEWQCPIRKQ
jgi:hypothetical protein